MSPADDSTTGGSTSGGSTAGRSAQVAPTAAVLGGSLAGIFVAAALASVGCRVTMLERDRLPTGAQSRHGVPQDRQPHILLHRGMVALERILPGFRAELLAHGAVSFDGGHMPWLGEYGWLDTAVSTYEVVSATRPLMELVARGRLARWPSVRICEGVTVRGLRRVSTGWVVLTDDAELPATVVVDATGRSSRLAHWLPELAPPEELVDAHVGYASRLYQERLPIPLHTGVMIFGSVLDPRAGLALPVEQRHWLVAAAGFGDLRPPRDQVGFARFLADLRDPAVADLTAVLEPVSDVAVHRQTANLRRRWDHVPAWPDGLLVVGDAVCALNPIYGQGVTVAARQAEIVARSQAARMRVDRGLQRRMVTLTDVPWSIATTNDLRMPSCGEKASAAQRWSTSWASRIGRLAAAGNVRATRTIANVNQLMIPPAALFHPALIAAATGSLPTRRLPRPAVLGDLSRIRRELPPADPADA